MPTIDAGGAAGAERGFILSEPDKLSLASMPGNPRNPRTMTDKARAGLGMSLDKFGDISCIVFNRRTDRPGGYPDGWLIAGHQRRERLMNKWGDLPLELVADYPDIHETEYRINTPDGKHYKVRHVEWDDATSDAAMVTANNSYIEGDNTDGLSAILEELRVEIPEMEFDGLALEELLESCQGAEIPIPDPDPPKPHELASDRSAGS